MRTNRELVSFAGVDGPVGQAQFFASRLTIARWSDCRRISCKRTSSAAKPRRTGAAGRWRFWPAFRSSPYWRSQPLTQRLRHAGRAAPRGFTPGVAAAANTPRPAGLRQAVAAAAAEASGAQAEPAARRCAACRPPLRVGWSRPASTRRRTRRLIRGPLLRGPLRRGPRRRGPRTPARLCMPLGRRSAQLHAVRPPHHG
jgi:hypothetical protein